MGKGHYFMHMHSSFALGILIIIIGEIFSSICIKVVSLAVKKKKNKIELVVLHQLFYQNRIIFKTYEIITKIYKLKYKIK